MLEAKIKNDEVACLAAATAAPDVTMTSTLSLTNSSAIAA
jgi:hypothetical protein